MHVLKNLQPVESHAGCSFVQGRIDALQGGINSTFGDGQKSVAVSPEQKNNRTELPGCVGKQQSQGQHGAWNGVAHPGQEGETFQPASLDPAFRQGKNQ